MKENYFELKLMLPVKLLIKCESEMKTYLDIQRLRPFTCKYPFWSNYLRMCFSKIRVENKEEEDGE